MWWARATRPSAATWSWAAWSMAGAWWTRGWRRATAWWSAACSASTTPACRSAPSLRPAMGRRRWPRRRPWPRSEPGSTMDFSKFFIDRPIFAVVLSIILFAVGLVAIPQLPVGEYPEVVPPSVVVRATYPGANPKEVAESVAVPLEEAINGVEGLMYMKSVAASDGSLQVVSTFRPDVDPDTAAVRVQNRVSQAQSRLPEEVRQFGVTTQKQSSTPLMYVGLVSQDGQHDALYLRNYVTLKIKDVLARIPGIGDVGIYGAGDYAMRVWLDPDKVAARQLTAPEVIAAIREQNIQVSAGQLGAQPSPQSADKLLSINVRGRLKTPEEFGSIVLKGGADGQVVRLADVARIELGASDYTLRSWSDKKNMAAVGIFLSPGANALGVAEQVYAAMDKLSQDLPEGVAFETVWDPTVFVRDRKSTRLNSSHLVISYAVFCLKKKKNNSAMQTARRAPIRLSTPAHPNPRHSLKPPHTVAKYPRARHR